MLKHGEVIIKLPIATSCYHRYLLTFTFSSLRTSIVGLSNRTSILFMISLVYDEKAREK